MSDARATELSINPQARVVSTGVSGRSPESHDKQRGLETICVGGGQGMAMVLECLS